MFDPLRIVAVTVSRLLGMWIDPRIKQSQRIHDTRHDILTKLQPAFYAMRIALEHLVTPDAGLDEYYQRRARFADAANCFRETWKNGSCWFDDKCEETMDAIWNAFKRAADAVDNGRNRIDMVNNFLIAQRFVKNEILNHEHALRREIQRLSGIKIAETSSTKSIE